MSSPDSTIVVDGTIDASSRRGSPLKLGPAANYPDCPSPDGAQDGGLPDFGSGGGGGGYATAGGKGGEGAGNNGAVPTSGISPLQPIGLRGGCAGGAGGALGQMTPGIGGGAVYLMAASITVSGIITVNGSGGGGGGSSGPGPGDGDGDDDTPEQPRNRAPRVSGPVQLVDLGGCQTLMIASLALLAGATDADADPLSIVGIQASRGQLTATEGGWVFKPQSGWYGAVTLTYCSS